MYNNKFIGITKQLLKTLEGQIILVKPRTFTK